MYAGFSNNNEQQDIYHINKLLHTMKYPCNNMFGVIICILSVYYSPILWGSQPYPLYARLNILSTY